MTLTGVFDVSLFLPVLVCSLFSPPTDLVSTLSCEPCTQILSLDKITVILVSVVVFASLSF